MSIYREACRAGQILAGVCLLAACGPAGPENTLVEMSSRVVFLSAHGELPYELGQRALLARLVGQAPNYELQTHDAGSDSSRQVEQLRQAVEAEAKAVLLDPLPSAKLSEEVGRAVKAGVLVIGLGENAADLGCSTVLSVDQKKLGQMAAEVALHALKVKSEQAGAPEVTGRVVEIRGDDQDARCQKRHEGFEAALKAAPGVILVHDAPGDWQADGGAKRVQDALRLQQTFDVVYAHNDAMAKGVAMALQDRRSDVMIIGTDAFRGPDGGMTLVGDGEIDATLFQPVLVDFAWALVRKKSETPSFVPKPIYEMPLRAILPKDVDEIRRTGLPTLPEL